MKSTHGLLLGVYPRVKKMLDEWKEKAMISAKEARKNLLNYISSQVEEQSAQGLTHYDFRYSGEIDDEYIESLKNYGFTIEAHQEKTLSNGSTIQFLRIGW